MRLVNSGFSGGAGKDEEYEGVDSGWRKSLATLKRYLGNYYGEPRANFLAMRPAKFSYDRVLAHCTDEGPLSCWLT